MIRHDVEPVTVGTAITVARILNNDCSVRSSLSRGRCFNQLAAHPVEYEHRRDCIPTKSVAAADAHQLVAQLLNGLVTAP